MTAERPPDEALTLTALERDALTELANVGVGRAARNLSRLVREEVRLSVPRAEVLTLAEAADALIGCAPGRLAAVEQAFAGPIRGQALLIFPEANSLELVSAALGDAVAPEEVADLEQGALAEIGNVILNGCLVVIANTLQTSLEVALPQLHRGDGRSILLRNRERALERAALLLYVDFALQARRVSGYIVLLMDLPALTALRSLIQAFLATLGPRNPGA